MKKFLCVAISFIGLSLFSQQNSEEAISDSSDKEAYYKPGENKLQKDFNRALSFAVDENYVINGVMTFTIYIDATGLAKIVDVKPKVRNHDLLIKDLNYVLRKTHKNWEAAQKKNKKVGSVFYYKIKFNTEVYDHD